jgi:hypothetical protein
MFVATVIYGLLYPHNLVNIPSLITSVRHAFMWCICILSNANIILKYSSVYKHDFLCVFVSVCAYSAL